MSSSFELRARRTADEWIELLLGETASTPFDERLTHTPADAEIAARVARKSSPDDLTESVRSVLGTIQAHPVSLSVLDFRFVGGTVGRASGERLVRAFARAAAADAMVVVTMTGGTRVHEGVAALFQMARLVAARSQLAAAAIPVIAIASDPTMGGMAGSIVATADVILSEPGCRLALGGPRSAAAVDQTARVDTAEQAQVAGLIDQVLEPEDMARTVGRMLDVLRPTAS